LQFAALADLQAATLALTFTHCRLHDENGRISAIRIIDASNGSETRDLDLARPMLRIGGIASTLPGPTAME